MEISSVQIKKKILFEKEGFAPKLNYYVFPKLQTHEKRPQITLMLANARAARRCHSLRSRPASQPLWSCQNYSLIHKATPKRLRSRSERSEDSDALRSRRLHLRYLRFFLNQFGVHHMKHNLGAKPISRVPEARVECFAGRWRMPRTRLKDG